ncbi:hypothetical protein [Caballeronia sp. BR00000012568055]|uniref:hypothetical protein n=1 Tax=Caballeronia sp. BR00000012568055 TaxID=2918761 RepID=UPI0023F835F0|nr:hypothetical protein [Caballeronia sp. BR00000012568055]
MKKTISTWWPVAILLPIALTICMHAHDGASLKKPDAHMGVSSVSAELARAISYGLIDDASAAPADKTL